MFSMTEFLKEDSKDIFYGQFSDNVKTEQLEYDIKTYEDLSDSIQGEHTPILLDAYNSATATTNNMLPCSSAVKKEYEDRVFYALYNGHKVYTADDTGESRQPNIKPSSKKRNVEPKKLEKNYSCRICSKRFTRASNLNRHLKLHSNIREFECPLCEKEFTQRAHRHKHMSIHFRASDNKCPKCGVFCTDLRTFNNHVLSPDCYSESQLPSVELDVEAVMPEPPPVKCPICLEGLPDFKHLHSHIVGTHQLDNVCPQCNKNHPDFNSLAKHLAECNVMFYSQNSQNPELVDRPHS